MNCTGKCHCGNIRYRATVNPDRVSLCHCTDCQVMSGGAYRVSALVGQEDYELVSGTPKIYVKTAESGNRRVQAFCGECGTHLYAENADNPTTKSLRLGTLDQRSEIKPRRQIWCRSALRWSRELKAIQPELLTEGKW